LQFKVLANLAWCSAHLLKTDEALRLLDMGKRFPFGGSCDILI
jgi:hypothetical protein